MSSVMKKTRRHFGASSEWQANSILRGISTTVFIASSFICVIVIVTEFLSNYALDKEMFRDVSFWVAICAGAVAAVAYVAMWRLYRKSYEIKEEPIVEGAEAARPAPKWRFLYAPDRAEGNLEKACGKKDDPNYLSLRRQAVIEMYRREFFATALAEPRRVFQRISENVRPGMRLMDCSTDYELIAPEVRGVRVFGLKDVEGSACPSGGGEALACNLVVPVSFQKRGSLSIYREVSGSGGTVIPVIKHTKIVKWIIEGIENYLECREADDAIWEKWGSLKCELTEYLASMKPNESLDVAYEVSNLMISCPKSDPDRDHDEIATTIVLIACMKDVIPVCVSLHLAACVDLDNVDSRSGEFETSLGYGLSGGEGSSLKLSAFQWPPRVFSLNLKEKCEMVYKTANAVPNRQNGLAGRVINGLIGVVMKRSDTVYYNLSRASRTKSYHLYVQGPEGTYYARGSILREDTSDPRQTSAKSVVMQRRGGQRNAQLYVQNGRYMSNVTFMFRFKKAPLDTYHIMFVAAFLCTAVLALCAIASIRSDVLGEGKMSGLTMVSMLLAVVSAAGPWVYNRTSDGREDNFGIEVAVVITTLCAVGAMIFFAAFLMKDDLVPRENLPYIWGVFISIECVTSVMVGSVALLHSSLYKYLLSKPSEDDEDEGSFWRQDEVFPEMLDGVRLDTPRGRSLVNPYVYWTRARETMRRDLAAGEEVGL